MLFLSSPRELELPYYLNRTIFALSSLCLHGCCKLSTRKPYMYLLIWHFSDIEKLYGRGMHCTTKPKLKECLNRLLFGYEYSCLKNCSTNRLCQMPIYARFARANLLVWLDWSPLNTEASGIFRISSLPKRMWIWQ